MNEYDFYYSQKALEHKKAGHESRGLAAPTVCEVYINGEWMIYTEAIHSGKKPLINNVDNKFLGTAGGRDIRVNGVPQNDVAKEAK